MVHRCTKAVSNELQTMDQGCHSALTSFAVFFVTERCASGLHGQAIERF